jgi:ATP-dependent Clp protease ATP-binding subunit ClpC
MYERLTDRARKVMQLANQEAHRFNHEYIGTEHVLLGLIQEGAGVAANVLNNLDLDLLKIRHEVEKIIMPGADSGTTGKLPQTPRTKKVIEYSIEEARNLNHNYVGTEHLLLGLLREKEGVAAQVLMNLGLKLEDVREEVLNLLGASTAVREGGHVEREVPARRHQNTALSHFPEDVIQVLQEINARMGKLIQEKEKAVAEQDFDKAGRLRDKNHKIKRLLIDAVQKVQTLIREGDDSST